MLITPESEMTPKLERTKNFQDASGNSLQKSMLSDQKTTHCCPSDLHKNTTCCSQSDMQTKPFFCPSDMHKNTTNCYQTDSQENNTHDKLDNASCISGLSCLRLNDKGNCSPPLSQKTQISNPKLGHLNNFTSKKSPRFVKRALFLNDNDDNDVFKPEPLSVSIDSPSTCSPPRSPSINIGGDLENKQLLTAGRLYLIRQIGNASQTSGSPSSPSRSFSKPFSFSSIGLSSPTSSPPSQHPLNSKRKLPVYVRVYKCNKDHFALISRDSSYSSRHIYLNMRHCRVMPGNPLGRFIVAGNSDSGSLMEFETTDLSSLEGWLDALQTQTPPESPIRSGISSGGNTGGSSKSGGTSSSGSPSLPKSPVLPTLTETDED